MALLILVLGAAIRFTNLGSEGLWCDEGYTAFAVREPLPTLLSRLLTVDDAPPLYYLVEKAAVSFVGRSEAGLRLASALAGVLSIVVLLWSAFRFRTPVRSRPGLVDAKDPDPNDAGHADADRTNADQSRADLWSAATLAFLTTGVFHARQARSYSLLLLFAIAFVLAARSLLTGRGSRTRKGSSWVLAVSGILLCLTHNVGIVLVLVSLVLWPLGTREGTSFRRWSLLHLPALAVSAMWILGGSQLNVHSELNVWTEHYWESHSLVLAPLYSMGLFVPGGIPSDDLAVGFSVPANLSRLWGGISVVCALACLASVVGGRSRGVAAQSRAVAARSHPTAVALRVELGLLLAPLVALTVVSLVVAPVYVLGRTDVLAYPAFALLMGRGLSRLPKWPAFGILLFWGGLSLLSIAPSYGYRDLGYAKGADRELAAQLGAELDSADWLVHTFMTSPSIEYYLERADVPHQTAWFPLVAAENTASDYPTPADSISSYVSQARRLRETIEAQLPETGDVWIFGLVAPTTEDDWARVREAGVIDVGQLGYPVSVFLYQLVGMRSVPVAYAYRQDWVAGDRVVLRVPKQIWTPVDEIPDVRFEVR